MPRCTHLGCQKEYEESDNAEGSCSYHPGGPVFHEGLKSWSCCNSVSKPVLEFDQFMAIPPCTNGTHTAVKPANAAPAAAASSAPSSYVNEQGVEVYGSAPPKPTTEPAPAASDSAPVPAVASVSEPAAKPAAPVVAEEDDPALPIPDGARCKRLACGKSWEGEDVSRGEGEGARCKHHPQGAIFHEGSKGYLCCKRRVLEFDEFMKIEGCTIGNHLFVGAKKDETKEEVVTCRIDHYQTPLTVHVSVFVKSADKSRSSVTFNPQELILDLYLPANKRVNRTLTLYGPISPEECTFRILGSKVEIVLKKPGAASWPLLELPAAGAELPKGYALTFGVTGRTGTVGGKEIVLSAEEAAKRG